MIKKDDWKTLEIPTQFETFFLERTLTKKDLAYIKEGHRPEEMEDKWFMYCENNKLFIHRSWTGYCIYIVELSDNGKLKTIVNRDPQQYKETDIEQDKLQLYILINRLVKQNEENARLMKLFFERRKS
ncbi:hypothetical protein [Absiella sp. AM29-15]|uniref:hypothetical protein n=1 Tax=Absiella sp. AM29-15 TaxID=2292278 RepID=UPI0018F12C4D|nr:hypothetical protein [Absiella sp. AM29-15]